MKEFHLQIVTPAGAFFDGPATQVTVPAVDGMLGVMAGHLPFVTALGKGKCRVYTESGVREAECAGGMIVTSTENVRVLASTFRWKE